MKFFLFCLKNLVTKKTKNTDKKTVNENKVLENDEDEDKICLDIDMSHICPSEEEQENGESNKVANSLEKEALNTSKKIQVYEDDDEEETIEYIVENLPADLKPLKDCMMNAQGCCLLLILKQFLKEVYSINDA